MLIYNNYIIIDKWYYIVTLFQNYLHEKQFQKFQHYLTKHHYYWNNWLLSAHIADSWTSIRSGWINIVRRRKEVGLVEVFHIETPLSSGIYIITANVYNLWLVAQGKSLLYDLPGSSARNQGQVELSILGSLADNLQQSWGVLDM